MELTTSSLVTLLAQEGVVIYLFLSSVNAWLLDLQALMTYMFLSGGNLDCCQR